jgi:DNA-directed RNA polymerase specialized sigma24 family protein
VTEQEQEQALAQVQTAVRRYVHGRTDEDREDVVQEAMTRLLENRARLEPAAWVSYAVVSAGNLLRDRERAGAVHRRHQHRLHTPTCRTVRRSRS